MLKQSRFSLIELLLVIAVISIIFSLLSPALRLATEQARRKVCLNNQRQIVIGATALADSNNGVFQLYSSWAPHFITDGRAADNRILFEEMVGSPEVLYCPSHEVLSKEDPRYGWDSLNSSRYMSYSAIGIWQQSSSRSSHANHYVSREYVAPNSSVRGNRPVTVSDVGPEIALVTDAQSSWMPGVSFGFPGFGDWPTDGSISYYSNLAYPHRDQGGNWLGTNVAFFDGSASWRGLEEIFDFEAPYPYGAKYFMHYRRGVYEGAFYW